MQRRRVPILEIAFAIVVLAVVAAILYPAFFRRHGSSARVDTCLNNLKSISQALKLYADDYNGQMPSSYLVSHSRVWSKRDAHKFVATCGSMRESMNTPDRRSVKTNRTSWPEVLYEHMHSGDIIFCPSDSASWQDADPKPSYWYKLANDKAWYGIGCNAPRRVMGDYAYEADQIAFYERLGWHWSDTSGLRNNVRVNASFIDTHVETIVIRNATSGDPANCATNSDGEPMYYNTYLDPNTGDPKRDNGPARHTDPTTCYDSF